MAVALPVAERYAAQGAWEQAARLYRSLLTLEGRHEPQPGSLGTGELLLRLGRCYLLGADPRHAETHARAFDYFRAAGDRQGMARAVLEAGPPTDLHLDATARAEEAIARFEGEDSEMLARLLAQRAVHLWDARADEVAARAGVIAEDLGLDEVRAMLSDRETHASFLRLDFARMRTAAAAAFSAFDRLGRIDEAAHMLADVAWPDLFRGDLDELRGSAQRALRYAVEHHVEPYEQVAAGQLATAALLRDDRPALDASPTPTRAGCRGSRSCRRGVRTWRAGSTPHSI